ncbi:RNA polymerase sigma factor [Candidatus Uhrbacteria bacterium]|nr:RNA polymerase sigma factor [Candidatus Uhrbacteria bacterium]
MDSQTEPALLAKIKRGDLNAFEQMLFIYEKSIFNHLYRLVGHRQDAEDLTQETFLKVYRKAEQINPEANFRAWLYKVATNTAYDWLRKKKKLGEVLVDESENNIFETIPAKESYDSIENKETQEEMAQALGTLKPIYKSVLMMYYYHDLSYQEIADALSLPINTVKTHIHRAKLALRQNLASLYGQSPIQN